MLNMQIKVTQVKDHYVIYINGKFYCSADNLKEVKEELSTIQN